MVNLKKKIQEETAFSTISRHREINLKRGSAIGDIYIFFYQF